MKNIGMVYCGSDCIPDEGMVRCIVCYGWYLPNAFPDCNGCNGCGLMEWFRRLNTRIVVYNNQNEKEQLIKAIFRENASFLLCRGGVNNNG